MLFGSTSKRNFSLEKIPDLTGKTAIITGSNTGIGRVCALEMAKKNATVVLACRNEEKTQKVVDEIKSETGNEKIEFIQIDLLELASVKRFADEFLSRHKNLDILMNNAGVMMCPFGLSKDGIETQFATNHVAHHYLTMLLLPTLQATTPSRVITVSSAGHKIPFKSLDLETISKEDKYSKYIHYAKAKTCNILFTRELSKRLVKENPEVYVNCNHPGVVRSDLYRHMMSSQSLLERVFNTFLISTEDGALTQLYLATSPEVEGKFIVEGKLEIKEKIKGQYYVPYAAPGSTKGAAASENGPLELWEFTEKLLKEKVPGYQGAPI